MKLGERDVNGGYDHDRIEVGRYDGRFSKLTMVVENSDLELIEFKVVFENNEEWRPPGLSHYFREGQRTRVIDLPGDTRVIRFIDLRYKNTPGGGAARVGIWGWKTGDAYSPPPPPPAPMPPPPPPRRWSFDARGWELLGERTVNGRVDRDRIDVGRYEGQYTKIAMTVEDSDLELIDLSIALDGSRPWHPATNHFFRDDDRATIIDLPGYARAIRHIDFRYRNVPGEGQARVRVYGRRAGYVEPPPPAPVYVPPPAPMPPPAASWDSRGWRLLGERSVDGRVDNDVIEVGRYEGRFNKLMLVVLDGDIEMLDVDVNFHHGDNFHPAVHEFFRADTRTHAIDLPGDDRVIKHIRFRYKALSGRPRVQVWGK